METIEEFLDSLDDQVEEVLSFKSGKIDVYGKIVGVNPCDENFHERQDHYVDSLGRVLRLDRYEREFSRPTQRFYHYEGSDTKVRESVWFDRYGLIDNIHRYQYCAHSGLMIDRAEYDRNGSLYYRILSSYTETRPLVTEDRWLNKAGEQLKRYVYSYDDNDELVQEDHYGKADRIVGSYHFEYDDRGNLECKIWYNQEVPRSTLFYAYDERDRVIEVLLAEGEEYVEARQTFVHDDHDNVVEETWYDAEDIVTKRLRY
jgi:hypothetical protein